MKLYILRSSRKEQPVADSLLNENTRHMIPVYLLREFYVPLCHSCPPPRIERITVDIASLRFAKIKCSPIYSSRLSHLSEQEDKHGHETVHKNDCRKGQCAQYAQRLIRFFDNSEFFPEKKNLNKNENKQFVQPKLGPDFSFSMAPSLVIRDREEKKIRLRIL
jgi:hypothetical protein